MRRFALLLALLMLAACADRFSADEYRTTAVQQANPVEQGVVLGSRRVAIAADGAAGGTAGAAAGGAVGGAAGGGGVSAALGAVGGALLGGIIGTTAERATANTDAIEYVVRQGNGSLVSVTQRDLEPLPNGTRVLVIKGAQARIVPDYTEPAAAEAPSGAVMAPAAAAPAPAPAPTLAPTTEPALAPAPAREALAPIAGGLVPPPPVVPAPPRPD
ncbi:hypothetical protein [Roseococcus suduntuyensis]|uniref:Outer membrane lipoprotein SlyB n=1 Tax=Roseococcus suduntuyensis TaxID=455361 RepID=A0A840A950_9PROT|nr:hypothetical protein [Roseococcus suduntuyensis]MBB3897627.1 outer membrane lipoprotein SlyB [Roseococcus suduntuyensis]